jgi:hypothetical protein
LFFSLCTNIWYLVRLVGQYADVGRVEVFYQGEWGTVCDDYWDVQDAKVICRQLGYNLSVTTDIHAFTAKPGTGTIWLDDVKCSGSEESLDECMHYGWGRHNCNHNEDVGVQCFNNTESEGK